MTEKPGRDPKRKAARLFRWGKHEVQPTEFIDPFQTLDAIFETALTKPEVTREDKKIIDQMKTRLKKQRENLPQLQQRFINLNNKQVPLTVIEGVTSDSLPLEPSDQLQQVVLRGLGSIEETATIQTLEDLAFDYMQGAELPKEQKRKVKSAGIEPPFGKTITLSSNIPSCDTKIYFSPYSKIILLIDHTTVDQIVNVDQGN